MRLMRKIRRKVDGKAEAGFTIVELLTVLTISVIIMAGMAGLIEMATNAFNQSRSLEAVTDSARRTLGSISREVKDALHILDDSTDPTNAYPDHTDSTHLTFWGDIDNDNPTADVDNWLLAERVTFKMFTGGGHHDLIQVTVHPAADPTQPGQTETITLASNVNSVTFQYYAPGDVTTPIIAAYNTGCGMVKVTLQYKRKNISRTFEQNIFLRILTRHA